MGHTAPDWSGGLRETTIFALKDLGELAVRLGSPVSFDRRGNVVFLDDFEGGVNSWSWAFSGEGGSINATVYPTFKGSYAVNIVPEPVIGGQGEITKVLSYPVESKVGIEVAFVVPALMDYFFVGAYFFEPTIYYASMFRYYHGDGTLKINDPEPDWVTVATLGPVAEGYNKFQIVKMVVDLETKKYERLIFNNVEYDISAYLIATDDADGDKYLNLYIGCVNGKTGEIELIVDNVILTQNEP